jgi:hypothetical protein
MEGAKKRFTSKRIKRDACEPLRLLLLLDELLIPSRIIYVSIEQFAVSVLSVG